MKAENETLRQLLIRLELRLIRRRDIGETEPGCHHAANRDQRADDDDLFGHVDGQW